MASKTVTAWPAGTDSDKVYVESTPVCWMHTTTFDLRDTLISFYLKEVETITVADGYTPYLFSAAYIGDTKYLTPWSSTASFCAPTIRNGSTTAARIPKSARISLHPLTLRFHRGDMQEGN